MGRLSRRHFLLSSALLAAPIAFAQPRRPYRIAVFYFATRKATQHLVGALEDGLRELGYVLGRDALLEFHSAEGRADRLTPIARQVVDSKPDVIVAAPNGAIQAVKSATRTIPIVMVAGTDVVRAGFIQSFARPGGNLSGLTWDVGDEIVGKRIELLKELYPKVARMAVLWEPPHKDQYEAATEKAASALGMATRWIRWSGDLRADLGEAVNWGADALLVHQGGEMFARRYELNRLAAQRRLATAHGVSEHVDAGGFMSYGANVPDLHRRAASYVDKILKGANPGELSVEQPTRLDFIINLRTAAVLGIAVAQSVLQRADRVIE